MQRSARSHDLVKFADEEAKRVVSLRRTPISHNLPIISINAYAALLNTPGLIFSAFPRDVNVIILNLVTDGELGRRYPKVTKSS